LTPDDSLPGAAHPAVAVSTTSSAQINLPDACIHRISRPGPNVDYPIPK
jgi:hypothetical protein